MIFLLTKFVLTKKLLPMKNIVGQTPRKENFFRRDTLVDKIYRRLDGGNNLFLSAPRRVGKTSIMRFLEDFPRENYQFVYVITESIYSEDQYYRVLLEELLKSDVLGKMAKASEKTRGLIDQILDRIKSVNVLGAGIELNPDVDPGYIEEFERLLTKLETQEKRIVVMVDEFPQTVENIKEKQGIESAKLFLQRNRSQRQQSNANIQLMFTGSIGLRAIVKKVGSLELINDLNEVEIPPLSREEATELAQQLFDSYRIPLQENVIAHLLDRIDWLIPFHIQLAVQEVIDIYELTNTAVTAVSVDIAFDRLAHIRNDIYFESYFSRLRKAFEDPTYLFAKEFLNQVADSGSLSKKDTSALADTFEVNPDECANTLESLAYDGYINNSQDPERYRFNSPILQLWWKKYKRR